MTASVEVNSKELDDYIRKLGKQAEKELAKTLNSMAEDLRTDAITKIKNVSGRSGNLRLFRGQGKTPYYAKQPPKNSKLNWGAAIKASAKGEYPAANTGFLANNIIVNQPTDKEANVISQAEYSAALEKDRPFMKMSLKAIEQKINTRLRNLLNKLAAL